MQGMNKRKYGVATTIDFQLYDLTGVDLKTGATFAAGDIKIMKDEGAEANTTNTPTDEGRGYSITLTSTEMEAARIVIYAVDQSSPKVWLDTAIVIETYGNASAQHAFDLDTATKVLTNKAVQDKNTGAIQYFDDDGQTVILTHTPSDTDTEITRQPS